MRRAFQFLLMAAAVGTILVVLATSGSGPTLSSSFGAGGATQEPGDGAPVLDGAGGGHSAPLVASETPEREVAGHPQDEDLATQLAVANRSLEEEWRDEIQGLSPDMVDELRRRLLDEITVASDSWFAAALELGPYDVVGKGSEWPVSWDETVVMRVRLPSRATDGEHWATEGQVRRAILPERQFPELYFQLRKVNWLKAASREMRLAEHRAQHAEPR
jgi:hypothetical protein